jgi:purine-nucleoside phosphorylase
VSARDHADPYALADQAAAALRERTGVDPHQVGLVLGSGWVPAAELLGETVTEFPVTELPGFHAAAVAGHAGALRSVRLADDRRALVFLGRTHLYEGRGVAAVVHGVRTAVAAGAGIVVLTNGCGDPSLEEGVYIQLPGPHYETPAEIGMVRAIGGDLVGMSTTLEAIAAREAGAEVLGISLVTNLAAGMTGEPLNHEEVLRAGRDAATRMGDLLAQVLGRM